MYVVNLELLMVLQQTIQYVLVVARMFLEGSFLLDLACQVWYNKNRVSKKTLGLLVRNMASQFGGEGNFSNKSLRSTSVTQMSIGQVLPNVGMMVTGHKRASSYQKYDASRDLRMATAQDIVCAPYDSNGKLKNYSSVLEEKIQNFCQNIDDVGAPLAGSCLSSIACDLKSDPSSSSKSGVFTGYYSGAALGIDGGSAASHGCSSMNCKSSSVLGLVSTYKVGDDLPFDASILKELPPASARALGLPVQYGWNFNQCVVNIYCGKENIPGCK